MAQDQYDGVSEQAKAGKHRRDDAQALFNSVRWRGAMHLAGYAVECALKTKLMRIFGSRHFRELEEELHRRGPCRRKAPFLPINWKRCCG